MKLSKMNLLFLTMFLALAVPFFLIGNSTAFVGDGAVVVNGAYTALPQTGPNSVCYSCHNGNDGPDIDISSYARTGHRNMIRKVTSQVELINGVTSGPYTNWKGPDGIIYTLGAGGTGGHGPNGTITWTAGGGTFNNIAQGGVANNAPIYYIWGDWIDSGATIGSTTVAHAPDVAYSDGVTTSSCGTGVKCHTTGYSKSSLTATPGGYAVAQQEPGASFPGNANVANLYKDGTAFETWFDEGIQCERCHGEAVLSSDMTQGAGRTHHGSTFRFKNADAQSGNAPVYRSGDAMQVCFNCHSFPNTNLTNGTAGSTILTKPSAGFLNSIHARYSGSIYPTAAAAGPNGDKAYDSGWPWATSPALNKSTSGMRGDLSDPAHFTSHFADTTYSITTPRFRYANSGVNCNTTPTCQSAPNSNTATSVEYYDVPMCSGAGVTSTATVTAGMTVSLPAFTCGTTAYAAATYTAAPSSTNGQNAGCTNCHNVHVSIEDTTADAFKNKCNDCHSAGVGIDLATIKHPAGAGTPLENMGSDPAEACVICHMPGDSGGPSLHVFRINVDQTYSTFHLSTNGTHVPNFTATDVGGSVYPASATNPGAVWVDLDLACGQCHGGSAGAGATANGAMYFDKNYLAALATGMHSASALPPTAGVTALTVTGLQVNFTDASHANPVFGAAPAVEVNWGDGQVSFGAAGGAFSHTYGSGGVFNILSTASSNNTYNSMFTNVTVTSTTGTYSITASSSYTSVLYILKRNGITIATTTPAGTSGVFSGLSPNTYTVTAYKNSTTGKIGPVTNTVTITNANQATSF